MYIMGDGMWALVVVTSISTMILYLPSVERCRAEWGRFEVHGQLRTAQCIGPGHQQVVLAGDPEGTGDWPVLKPVPQSFATRP